ncbi:pyrroline-5-carboxylate reductase [Paracoccus pantotrophus]|uniref:Pyrroline-5-carboxylate reductase n=1 Tax=Paracoccus pantotrophus TaxID=82367 RepID=A0AAE6TUP2_PARPN|nr:pyrroline-5-carboxylate reductase dimerization domain-containing protein [Paracoccus pantotrophus]QFG37498.1 hypothetical protein ESD82_15310 [Paracoccus pantotrophus]RKS52050.1 pyrroline-5-carboxylate reductase [Paracoccus pantotrophus]
MTNAPTLLFIGCGNMGASIIGGAVTHVPQARLVALDPDLERARSLLPAGAPVALHATADEIAELKPDLVILGVKPQVFGALDPALMQIMAQSDVVSIMAGIPLERLVSVIGHERIARTMPNLPAMLAAGATLGCVRPESVSPATRKLVEDLFGALGLFDWVEDEASFELANPVFACGPGFIFAFAEQMILAAERSGVDPQLADRLVRQTFLGAARMLSEDDRDAAALKRAVTSPNGTTQAGLTALEDPSALPAVVPETLRRAHARALELAAEA